MSTMSSALENEDLENVPLVRMEDVQPSRTRVNRAIDPPSPPTDEEEIFETCIIDKEVYENDYEVNEDSDSNIGSMVSIQSDEIPNNDDEEEDSDSGELIVPEVLDPPAHIVINVPAKITEEKTQVKSNGPDSWPTLEILPGGVIKNSVECEGDAFPNKQQTPPVQGDMVYACAKCSQAFKYLFCLVKHVKWHEDQNKYMNNPKLRKLKRVENSDYICLHSGNKKVMLADTKKSRRKLPKRLKS